MKKHIIALNFIMLALFSLSACDKSTDHGEAHSPEGDVCEHMEKGPVKALTADASAPLIITHTRYDITLTGEADAKKGSISLEADETIDFVFGLDKNISFKLQDSDGNTLPKESSKTSDLPCADIVVSHTYELDAGNYVILFGPGPETEISLVMVEAGSHEH